MGKHTIAATVVALVAVLAVAGVALAGKPSSSLSLVVVPSGEAAAATAEPSYGDHITFDVATTETDRPFVNLRCYQGDNFVADGWEGFFASYVPEPVFTLSSDYWTGGAADCTAYVTTPQWAVLGSTSFHVYA